MQTHPNYQALYDAVQNLSGMAQGHNQNGDWFLSREELNRKLKKIADAMPKPAWRFALFAIDDDPKGYWGFTQGQTWNGWAMPAFGWNVVKVMLEKMVKSGGMDAVYDETADAWYVWFDEYADEPEPYVYEGFDIVSGEDNDTHLFHVYAVGAGEWVWYEVTQEDDDEDVD